MYLSTNRRARDWVCRRKNTMQESRDKGESSKEALLSDLNKSAEQERFQDNPMSSSNSSKFLLSTASDVYDRSTTSQLHTSREDSQRLSLTDVNEFYKQGDGDGEIEL